MKKTGLIFLILLLSSCVSYYDEYEQSFADYRGYNYYNSPLRIRGLNTNDFYMLDNHPGEYFNTQMWSTIGNVSTFAIHNIVQGLAH